MPEGQSDNNIPGIDSKKSAIHPGWGGPVNEDLKLEIETRKLKQKEARRNARNHLLQARREADQLQKKGAS